MASNILIKRSTGATAPGTITFGELAVTIGGNGTQANADDRLFVGDNNGAAQIIGGKYFTDMLDHVAGTLTASSSVIVDSNSKIDNWNVDDINLNGNTITTGTADTDLVLAANGTGKIVIQDGQELEFGTTGDLEFAFNDSDAVLDIKRAAGTPDLRIADDVRLYFGTNKDGGIRYDETSLDKVRVDGADWEFDNQVAVKIADSTASTNSTSGALQVVGGVGVGGKVSAGSLLVEGDAQIGDAPGDALTVNSTTTFQNGVTFNGTTTIQGNIGQTGEFTIDQLKMDGNVISTTAGTEMIIDPYPAGGDAAGLVIIKGDLQIDGTTTTVNSAEMSVNDPTIALGDPTTVLTNTSSAASGQAEVVVDRVTGISAGDSITSASGVPGSTTISSIDVGTKTLTLSANLTGTLAVGTTFTVTRSANDALDRGVKVHYYDGSNSKFGFFGFDRSGGADGLGAWTFIENATDTNGVFGVTGQRGTVVLGDLELDTDLEVQFGGTGASTFTANGIIYGNTAGALQVTAAANMASPGTGTDATTSYQILTVTSTGVPVWTNTIDGGTF
tara:strand:+ start:11127 stop:12803 length:1677 start_codon:yes stop_codon:yes gene_type:complete